MSEGGKENWAVDELLKAEEEANTIIKNAQTERDKRLKEAKISAEQEINLFKKEEEDKYQKIINERYGKSTEEDDLEKKTKVEIDRIFKDYEANKSSVIDMLLERIINVELEIPEVVKGNFEKLKK